MTFYIGQKSAGEIYLGSKKIGRLYLGQTLVHMTSVVSKPTFLEYVEFDGESYINTGIYTLSTWNIGAVGEGTTYLRFLIANGGAGAQYFGYHSSGYWGVGVVSEFLSKTLFTQRIDCTVTFANGSVTATIGDEVLTRTGQSIDGVFRLGGGIAGTPYYFKGKIYYCRNYNTDGVLIQDLRPCIDPKGVVCFYDTVTNKYFYNQGTGTLTYTEHEELEYLEFDGTHCIDTGLYPNSNMRVESTFVYEGHTEDDGFTPSRGMYGAKGSGSYIALYSDGYQKWGGVNSVYMEVSVFKDKKVNALQDKNGVVVDGVLYEYTSVPEDFVNTTNTFLIGDTNGSSARPFIGKMYGLKLYENNVLLRDFVPVKRSDGVKCMYDRVGNKYYELKEV